MKRVTVYQDGRVEKGWKRGPKVRFLGYKFKGKIYEQKELFPE